MVCNLQCKWWPMRSFWRYSRCKYGVPLAISIPNFDRLYNCCTRRFSQSNTTESLWNWNVWCVSLQQGHLQVFNSTEQWTALQKESLCSLLSQSGWTRGIDHLNHPVNQDVQIKIQKICKIRSKTDILKNRFVLGFLFCRRMAISEAFLTADAVLQILLNVFNGLVVYPAVIDKHLKEELPFLASENVIIAMVKCGGNRQVPLVSLTHLMSSSDHVFDYEWRVISTLYCTCNDDWFLNAFVKVNEESSPTIHHTC